MYYELIVFLLLLVMAHLAKKLHMLQEQAKQLRALLIELLQHQTRQISISTNVNPCFSLPGQFTLITRFIAACSF
jgi:predicted Holliday junction resolvase-like endonuclease